MLVLVLVSGRAGIYGDACTGEINIDGEDTTLQVHDSAA